MEIGEYYEYNRKILDISSNKNLDISNNDNDN